MMTDEQLQDKCANLAKAIDKQEPAKTLLPLLKELDGKGVPAPTENVLRSTRVGRYVNKLSRHPDTAVRTHARNLLKTWKDAVDAKKGNQGASNMTPRTSTPSNTASPAPATPTPNPPYVGNIEKRHFKIDNVNINIHSDVQRNNCIGLLYNGLAFMGRDSVDFVAAKATEAEGAAFKTYKGNTPEYRAKIRSLFQNLKVRSNSELRRRVLTGVIDATEFVKMSQEELKSQEHKERDRAYERENINNAQVAQPEKSISDALTCGKCGQKKVSYTQAQTRSADEPMTTFCECLHCGNRWKFS